MSMENETGSATVRPWHANGTQIIGRLGRRHQYVAEVLRDAPVATVRANTSLIVRAVNEHEALAAAVAAAAMFAATIPLATLSATQLAAHQDFSTALAAIRNGGCQVNTSYPHLPLQLDNLKVVAQTMNDFGRVETTPAQRALNDFIESWDAQTDYAFDQAGIYLIACLIVDHAQYVEFKRLCAEAGLFI